MAKKRAHNSPKVVWIIAVVVLFVLFCVLVTRKPYFSKSYTPPAMVKSQSFDFENAKIMLDEQKLTFVNGAYKNADHNASITNRSVNPAGTKSAAVLMDNPGGSGTFYYIIGASLKHGKTIYSKPVLLGDRIKFESVTVDNEGAEDNGIITVTYFDRPEGTDMAAELTEKMKARYAFQEDGNLIPIIQY